MPARRPLIVEGLNFFLEHLPGDRLAAIIAGQLALSPDAPAAERLVALLGRCPSLHKLGQVLARQAALPPALRRHPPARVGSRLLSRVPPSDPWRPPTGRR